MPPSTSITIRNCNKLLTTHGNLLWELYDVGNFGEKFGYSGCMTKEVQIEIVRC
jgi:hypothetical protein